MTRPIDADAVYKWYLEAFKGRIKPNEIRFSMNDICGNLQNIPTIDAEPVRHGKWISTEKLYGYENVIRRKGIACSVCDAEFLVSDYHFIEDFRYCPNCGARMDKDV